MNGVRVSFLNREEVLKTLKERSTNVLNNNPDVVEISLFGSLARMTHTPASDADVLIILSKSVMRLPDRAEYFGRYFDRVGVNVEVFPYTIEEIEKMGDSGGFIRGIMKGRVVIVSAEKQH